MNAGRVAATAARVLRQLRHDPRTVALMLIVPCVLLTLLRFTFDHNRPQFDRSGPVLLAIFPFTVMFVISSVAMLRERVTGTLERLLTTPMSKLEIILGYALAFAGAAFIQVALATAVLLGPLDLRLRGDAVALVAFAVLDALLGMALGLLLSAFASTEFQAVQFLPAVVLPQLLLCGLFSPRGQMAPPLQWLSDAFPLTYAVDGVMRVASDARWEHHSTIDLLVVVACIPAALLLAALSLRRRTA